MIIGGLEMTSALSRAEVNCVKRQYSAASPREPRQRPHRIFRPTVNCRSWNQDRCSDVVLGA